jgi:predicted CoA-substrate-specific enzyme activase
MYFLGLDIGSSATKAAAVDENGVLVARAVTPLGAGTRGVDDALAQLYAQSGLPPHDCKNIIATGYGRMNFAGASEQFSEIICHAKGVKKLLPAVHTVIDIGGQDSKAIQISAKGTIQQFAMNDKCAAGTGRFLEVMCRVMGIAIEKMGEVGARATQALDISNTCAVFAESEVISKLAEGKPIPDIIGGVHAAVARRVAGLVMRVGLVPEVALTGGVAQNAGIRDALARELKTPLLIPPEPQITGALGAALFAWERGA